MKAELISKNDVDYVDEVTERARFLARRLDGFNLLDEIAHDFNDIEGMLDELNLIGNAELADPGVRHRHKTFLEGKKILLHARTALLKKVVPDVSSVTIAKNAENDQNLNNSPPKVILQIGRD